MVSKFESRWEKWIIYCDFFKLSCIYSFKTISNNFKKLIKITVDHSKIIVQNRIIRKKLAEVDYLQVHDVS